IKNLIDGRWKYLISLSENQNFYSKEKFNIEKPSYKYLKEIFKYIQEECGKDLEDSLKKDYKKYILKSDDKLIKLLQNDFKLIFASEAYNGNKFRKKDDVPHKEYLLNLQEKLRESLAQEIYNEILIPYESKLMELNREIYKIYDEIKIRERRFTFNDIAVYAYMSVFEPKNLLIDKNGLNDFFYEALDMKIDTIFIDEFQDTSVLQWKILFEIIKKSENVICVGDEKQSIYGWRGGEKRLFENLDTIINADNETMDISYRSDINIVEYTNKIFNKISSEEEKWKFENSKANSEEKGYVKAIFLEKTKEEENNISIERKLVNELIKTDLKNYSDIAIIARKNSELKEIAEILEEEKIPYKLSFEKNINNLSGVFELIQLLKYLIFDRELSLFNFLASDLSFFGTDEIEFLLKNKEETLNYLNGIENLNFNKTLFGKISLFLEKIKKIKEEYINYSTQDLVYRIFNEFNFYKIFNKDIELKNLTEVFLFSKKYENLFDLLKAFEKNEIEFSENAIESSAVELLTIHKSKGLQFKTVFVLNKKDKNRTQALDFIFTMDDNYNTVKFSLFTKKSYEKVIEICFKNEIEKLRLNQREEEINNLYVALTRAKNNLIFLSENEKYFSENELKKIEEIGELKFFPVENLKNTKENRNY
ncbi:MAG: UvrD-helicase domain-containing protein, partial [Fusobacterium sp.]|nr:UvrD-helicase domain-containing protein [Fusobacterium sp.]